jgi:hypothetical protein
VRKLLKEKTRTFKNNEKDEDPKNKYIDVLRDTKASRSYFAKQENMIR